MGKRSVNIAANDFCGSLCLFKVNLLLNGKLLARSTVRLSDTLEPETFSAIGGHGMNDWVEFRHFAYLLAIADYEGFRAAAEYLHTGEPNLSVQAKRFQEMLGIRLFKKGPKGRIQLTETGIAFKAIARELLQYRDDAIAALIAIDRGKIKSLTLGSASCLIATSCHRIGQCAGSDLPRDAPAILAPPAFAFLTAIADYGIPVTIGLFLIVSRNLEGKGLRVLEGWTAIETETGNPKESELHRQGVALLTARKITGSFVSRGYDAIGKSSGIEASRLQSVLPDANRVLWFRFGHKVLA
jgi:hypothetical protein